MTINSYQYILLGLFFSLLIPLSAQATDIIDQQQPTASNAFAKSYWAQTFIPTKDNFSRINIKSLGCIGAQVYLCAGNNITNDNVSSNYNCAGNSLLASTTDTIPGGGATWDWTLPTPVRLTAGSNYYLGIYCPEITKITMYYFADSYANGKMYCANIPADGGCASNLDLYFKEYYSDQFYNIVPITPTEGQIWATSTIPFSATWYQPSSAYNSIFYEVYDKQANSYEFGAVGIASTSGTFIDHKILIDSSYSWTAYFISSTSTAGTSTPQNFEVAVLGTATSTCLFDISECDSVGGTDFFGGITCGLKKFSIWALCPNQQAQNNLQNSYQGLKNSFPFSAFFDLTDTVSYAISTTTTNMNGTIDLTFINKKSDFITLPILSSSSLSNTIGATNSSLFRNSITWILWCLAGFLVFITIKKI